VALLEAHALLYDVSLAAQINHALHLNVRPWELHDWPADYLIAARALAARYRRTD
jgi:hypothetical protein